MNQSKHGLMEIVNDSPYRPKFNLVKKTPPHSLETECCLLGTLALMPQLWESVASRVESQDFYDTRNRRIFGVMAQIAERDGSDAVLSPVALQGFVGGAAEELGGLAYLSSLGDGADIEVETHVRTLLELSQRRRQLALALQLAEQAFDADETLRLATVAELSHSSRSLSERASSLESKWNIPTKGNCRNFRSILEDATVAGDMIPLVPERPKGVEFPQTPWHGLFVCVQKRTQAPLVLCAQSVMAAMTLAVQHLADIEIPGVGIGSKAARRPIANFFLTIARSGERKSSVDRIVLQGIRELQREREDIYQREVAEWKNFCANMERGAVKPPPPMLPYIIVQEGTSEGIFKSLQSGPWSQGLFSDEGGNFIGGYGMSADSRARTTTQFNQLWDGSAVQRSRVTEQVILRDRRLSLHLMVQPKVSDELLGDSSLKDNGFTARCLIAEPTSTIGEREFREPSVEVVETCNQMAWYLKYLAGHPAPRTEGNIARPVLRLNEAARELWIEFYNEVESKLNNEYRGIQGFAAKAPEHAIRLAAVFALEGELRKPEEERLFGIASNSMQVGIDLMQFYLAEQLRLQVGRATDEEEDAQLLMDWLRSDAWDESFISIADICRRGPSVLRKKTKAQAAVEVCLERSHLKLHDKEEVIKGSKRRKVFKICCDSATEGATDA